MMAREAMTAGAKRQGSPGATPVGGVGVAWGRVVRTAAVLVPSTFLTALLYYFGQAYTNYVYEEFGVDGRGLDFSTADYLVDSVGVTISPLRNLVIGVLVVAVVHGFVSVMLTSIRDRCRRWRVISVGLVSTGALVGAFLIVGLWQKGRFSVAGAHFDNINYLYGAVGWMVGVSAVVYAGYLLFFWKGGTMTTGCAIRARLRRPGTATFALGLALLMVSQAAFDVTEAYAYEAAKDRASDIEEHCADYPLITFRSAAPLYVSGEGVTHEVLQEDGETIHSYAGLRLFIHENERFIVWPVYRSPRQGMTIVPETETMVIQFEPQPMTRGPGRPAVSHTLTVRYPLSK